MEFGWSPQEQAHRQRIRDLLEEALPEDWEAHSAHGPGSGYQTDFSLQFCPMLAERDLLVPNWPRAFGGQDAPVWQQFILGEEMWAAGEPRGAQYMNVNWIGPTLMKFGTPEQIDRYLPPIREGRAIWCQGFSEPSAGSDLAALRTQAVPVEGGYRVTGAKIWTSYAGRADHCFLLARVAPRAGGSAGKASILILLVDMASPGIQVKQIPALIGEGDIHELFLDDVFVPEANRLGAEGQAWDIITAALQNERTGIARYEFSRRMLDRAVERLKARGRWDDPTVRERAAQALMLCEAARLLVYRVVDARARDLPADAFPSVARWAVVQADNGVNDFLTECMPEGLTGSDPVQVAHHQRAIAAGIASGAAEIQLNLIARRWLELPGEPKR
ncbi:acyl-CoA dehydrogenase family protein [Sandaracinobacter sp. RS1-74]|uniref:acyl-CoA dehydrogenase family protein n=1 Tax=Sandaracinobacteroides sayramensis TaxID=2913411 RepID=UPI001EDB7C9D|nr:acyl-CoA dehydrogenase family protein [Sandaracinobacteroides sayramensis]MCG2842026.1 acyl-CoA dehydrogenase family protein [Sandaracinobacteroides sayramensis]